MDINYIAPVTASHELLIQATVETIWAVLTNIEHWPTWNTTIKSALLDSTFEVGSTFKWKSGGASIVSTLAHIEPTTRLVWTGKAIGTKAIHVWTLQTTSDGVLVRTAESLDGWLVILLRTSIQKTLSRTLVSWLEALKEQAENDQAKSDCSA